MYLLSYNYEFFQMSDRFLRSWIRGLINFLDYIVTTSVTIGGTTYYLFDFMFGMGVTLFAGYQFAKWLIDVT